MLLLVPAALAHPDSLPHVHPSDPTGLAVVAFWVIAGAVFFAVARRATLRRATLEPAEPLASD